MADNLSQLLATPLQPQREQWYSAAQAELPRPARARHEISPDAYWTWVAEQQRWMQPWDIVRTGEIGDFSYFGGGRMNVADRTGGGVPLQAKEISYADALAWRPAGSRPSRWRPTTRPSTCPPR